METVTVEPAAARAAPAGKTSKAVATRQSAKNLAAVDTSPEGVLRLAISQGAPLEQLEKFMDLKDRHDKNEARKAYVAAMAEFKKNPPEILKDKAVGYTTKEGDFVGYKHASIGNVTSAICAGLAAHGFSHSWDVQQAEQIIVTCKITHALGHFETVAMRAAKDDSGKKNAIQQVASTVTYLQRYTLLAATGLAVQDDSDDDGQGAGEGKDSGRTGGDKEPYTEEQFNKNLPQWRELVKAKKKTPEAILATLDSKFLLLDSQRKAIRELANAHA